jgi:hypothetical protein
MPGTFDRNSDELRPLSFQARGIPNRRGTNGVGSGTPWRWAMKGCFGVRLRTQLVGGIRMTTGRWLGEFFDAVTAAKDGKPPRTDGQRQSELEADEREAAALGV